MQETRSLLTKRARTDPSMSSSGDGTGVVAAATKPTTENAAGSSSFEVIEQGREQEQLLPHPTAQSLSDNDWTMVETGGELTGMKSVVDKRTGTVHSLSSHDTCDADRWTVMPSLEDQTYESLKHLDLYKNRYLRTLHESVCDLSQLEVLSLVRCERLTTLPDRIGELRNLRELDLIDASEISSLPESLGDLQR
jgi:Leucine-rich repeat (LRR) protein